MTPRRFDPEVVHHLAAAFLEEAPVQYQASFDAAARVGALPDDLADRLAPSAGQRNILVRRYLEIAVADGVEATLEGYRRYVEEVARFVADRSG